MSLHMIGVLPFLFLGLLLQQKHETLDGTLQWLAENLTAKAAHTTTFVQQSPIGGGTVTKVTCAEFEMCSLKVVTEERINTTFRGNSLIGVTKLTYQIPLGKLDENAVDIIGQPVRGIELQTVKKAKILKEQFVKFRNGQQEQEYEEMTHYLVLPMPDKSTALQFQQAFKNVIKQCKQK